MEQLITKADFEPFRFLSVNLDAATINPYILEAQRADLAQVLGEAMYYQFWKAFQPQDPPVTVLSIWTDLLNGKEYEHCNNAFYFYGVKPYLVYRTFARFLNKSQVKMTRAGAVSKRTDESDYIDKDTLDKLRAETDSFSELYKRNLIHFLNVNRMYYPLWPYLECGISRTQRKGLKIYSVSRSTWAEDYYTPMSYLDSQLIINNIYTGGGSGYVE